MNLKGKWKRAREKGDYQKLYFLILKILKKDITAYLEEFKKIRDDHLSLKEYFRHHKEFKTSIFELFQFLELLSKDLPNIIDKNYEKTLKINNILDNFYERTFQGIDKLNFSNKDLNKKVKDLETQKLHSKEKEQKRFFIKKIREILEDYGPNLLNLLQILDLFVRQDVMAILHNKKKDLIELLIFLVEVFPDISSEINQKSLELLEKGFLKKEEFQAICKKCMDQLPYPVISTLVNHIHIIMNTITSSSKICHDLEELEIILEIFREYAEYYPNYFSTHINLYYGLIGRYVQFPRISKIAGDLLEFFAKQAHETINQIFFKLYEKLTQAKSQNTHHISNIMHSALLNGDKYVFSEYYDKENGFDEDLKEMVYQNLDSQDEEVKQISLEIAIGIWNIEMNLIVEEAKSKTFSWGLKRKIRKPIQRILKVMIREQVESPYLFMQAVEDFGLIMEQVEDKFHEKTLKDRFLQEEKMKRPKDFFQNIRDFISYMESL